MGGDVVYQHVDGWSSFALVLPTAVASATRAIYDDPATARSAHGVAARYTQRALTSLAIVPTEKQHPTKEPTNGR
jgi:hypothetical protein